MNQNEKNQILEKSRIHLSFIQTKIKENLKEIAKKILRNSIELKHASTVDRMVQEQLSIYNEQRQLELKKLLPSPYFVRCDVVFDDENEQRTFYFAKFALTEESIHSWIAPVASIRFENCGRITYIKNDGKKRHGELLRKDQFMIVDGKIVFMASENENEARQLIHQEYFSQRKTGFVLPEILEQMEKAQDKVIRAHHQGPFVISGPAGSGKTTLALHRVAFLAQSPETADEYTGKSIIVFVQDANTKNYFGSLLPELGINNVKITTFSEWAFEILDIKDYTYINRFGGNELEKDLLEYEKNQIHLYKKLPPFSKSYRTLLDKLYSETMSNKVYQIYKKQKESNMLDRFDLTILLKIFYNYHSEFLLEEKYYVMQKDNSLKEKFRKSALKYSLIIVDEFQNYLPEQLKLIKTCIKQNNQSMIYVGDMKQQVKFSTITNWGQINENIEEERKVILNKVYRNTKNILEFIQDVGYEIEIPKEIKNGKDVVEIITNSKSEEINYIEELNKNYQNKIFGIIAKEISYLNEFKTKLKKYDNIHCLSMEESQGVEFDIVIIVGINKKTFQIPNYNLDTNLKNEKAKIQKDLLYVALTRAIEELHILGQEKISKLINQK